MQCGVAWLEKHQVALCLAGLVMGAVLGLAMPTLGAATAPAISPLLALLLYATFLGIPLCELGRSIQNWRFLSTLLLLNFVVVPLVAWPLSRLVAHDQALLLGVLVVLLTPCIDYVIVFSGLAGGNTQQLLAATPLLMLAQLLLLPLYLLAFVGPEVVALVNVGVIIEAFGLIILLPLLAAGLTQALAFRTPMGRRVADIATGAMVPLMVLTLLLVVAAHISGVSDRIGELVEPGVIFLIFAALLAPLGILAGRVARLGIPEQRSLVFSGVTRNSLVVLPLVLALPPAFSLTPLVVVTQTLVELLVMVILVRLVPRLLPISNKQP